MEARLQQLISGHPWLLDSLHLLVRDFMLQLHPLATTARLLTSTEDVLSELPDVELPGLSEPSPRRKRRLCHRCITPQPDIGTLELLAVVSEKNTDSDTRTIFSGSVFCAASEGMTAVNETGFPGTAVGRPHYYDYYEPTGSQLMPAQAFYRMLGIIILPPGSPSVSTPQPEQPRQSFSPSRSSTSAPSSTETRRKCDRRPRLQQESNFPCGRPAGMSEKDFVPPPFVSGNTQNVFTKTAKASIMNPRAPVPENQRSVCFESNCFLWVQSVKKNM